MELPEFHHHLQPPHHHRYVPPLSENPNFCHPHPDHRLGSPPSLQQPYHHLSHPRPPLPLPPPAPTPAPSRFSYRLHHHRHPVEGIPSPSVAAAGCGGGVGQFSNFTPSHLLKQPPPHHLSPSRIPSHQNHHQSLPFFEESSGFADRWRNLPPPPPGARSEPAFHHSQRQHLSPIPQPRIDHYMNDYERNLRFRDEAFRYDGNRENPLWSGKKGREFDVPGYVNDGKYRFHSVHDGFERFNSSGFHSVHDGFERFNSSGFERGIHRVNRDVVNAVSEGIGMILSPTRDFASDLRSYDSHNDRGEDTRWRYYRLGNANEFTDGDGVSLPSHGIHRELVDTGYDDLDKLNNNWVGDGVEFFNRSPRKKQLLKKSALLRIQMGKPNNKSNYRSRSHENGRYSRSYHDESNLNVGGGFNGKGKGVFAHIEEKIDGDREKSPVELDVSFKSNALIAKARKNPLSSGAEADSNCSPGNRKLKKISLADSVGTKWNDVSAKATHVLDPLSSSVQDHQEFKEKIVSFQIDNSARGLDYPSRSYRHEKERAEKIINGETDSNEASHDFPSGSDKDMKHLADKTLVPDSGTTSVGANNGGKESAMSVGFAHSVKRVAPDGVLQRVRKGKSARIDLQNDSSLQSVDVICEPSDPDGSSTGSLSATSQLEEDVTHSTERISSPGINETNDVFSSSIVNELMVNKLNNASEDVVSDSKEDSVRFCSILPLPSESSALKSVSWNPADTIPFGDPSHVDKLGHIELPRLSSHNGIVESKTLSEILVELPKTTATFQIQDVDDGNKFCYPNEPVLVENCIFREFGVSVDSNAGLSRLKENKVVDFHKDASTSSHKGISSSKFEEDLCISPKKNSIADMASKNAAPEDFHQHEVNNASNENDIIMGSPDANLSASFIDTVASPKLGRIHGGAGNHDLSDNLLSFPASSPSNDPKLDHCSKQSIVDGATTPSNVSTENSLTSTLLNSEMVGRKRKATDWPLDGHDAKARKIVGTVFNSADDEDRSLILQSNTCASSQDEIVHENGENSLGKYCLEESFADFKHLVQEGEIEKDFSSILTSSVPSEFRQGFRGSILSHQFTEHPSNIEDGMTQSESYMVKTTFTGLSVYAKASVRLLQDGSIAEESNYGGPKGLCSKLADEISYDTIQEVDGEDKSSRVICTSDLQSEDGLLNGGYDRVFVGPDVSQKQPIGDTDYANSLPLKEDLGASSDSISLGADVGGVSATSSTSRQIESFPDTLSNMGSPEDVISNFSSDMFSKTLRQNRILHRDQGKDNTSDNNPVLGGDLTSFPRKSFSCSSIIGTKSGDAVAAHMGIDSNTASFLSQNSNKVTQKINPVLNKSSLISNRLNVSVIKAIPGRMSTTYLPAANMAPSNHIAKSRTWHRNANASPSVVAPKSQGNCTYTEVNSKKEVRQIQNSYVRGGNSLVRKPSPVGAISQTLPSRSFVYPLSSDISNQGKGGGSENRIDTVKQPYSAKLGESNDCAEKLDIPPPTEAQTSFNSGDLTFLPLADPARNVCSSESNDPSKSAMEVDTRGFFEEDRKSYRAELKTGMSNSSDYRAAHNKNLGKKILYVKRKSNQLVAASNSKDIPLDSAEKSEMSSSDYVKRGKNQLIRTSVNEIIMQNAFNLDKSLSSRRQDSENNIQIKSSGKRSSGFRKRKFSLVWTLHDTLSSRQGGSPRWHRMRPYLFPWKRASHWTNFNNSLSSFPNDSPISIIRQKLLLSRNREAIYKRSGSGFSLRRSKVLGVGGRNLKWSKSIEKNSRKANADATLAVAAAEKQKRAQNLATLTLFKSRNYVSRKSGHSFKMCPVLPVSYPGERIFRIGSERYRMDPTRKTLQRISDEQCSILNDQSEKNRKKLFVPRRLLIGNDEYIRIGNGNKLMRDPKRRIRILASEKVRWSLHTARLRLARKKKYCQFFTRFGKCKKDEKRCPYIHDPSKIAVCTKFLNGSCSNPSCKLTHKVIPERMQDCSYFLRGLCSNESCPYRHVNVNPNSPVCEAFLRGYCADGNECSKKHNYVCPVFESTGSCPLGPDCKLHHPKKKKKGMTGKASNIQKNARGRYFGAGHADAAGVGAVCNIIAVRSDGNISGEGGLGDYVSLDIRTDEREQGFELRGESTCVSEGPSEMKIAEDDELTKPIRVMNKNVIIDSSPAADSSSEMATGYVSEESHFYSSVR